MATTKITNPNLFDLSTVNTALRLPNGGTLTRPTSASQGEWRFNTDLKYVEFYDGGEWRQIDTEVTCTTNTVDYPTTNVAYYKLDSSAADQTTNNYDGTETNMTYCNGQEYSQGAVFNGSSSYITLPVGLGTSGDRTRSFWLKVNNLAAVTTALYIGDLTQNAYYETVNIRTTGVVRYQERHDTVTNSVTLDSSSTIQTNTWNHIAYVFSGSTRTLYLNGAQVGQTTSSYSTVNNSSYGGYIGGFGGVNNPPVTIFDGKMDQFRFFSSELTLNQITELYNEVQCPCTTNTVDEPTTNFAYYKLDGNANDATNTYNGTWGSTEAYEYGPYGIAASFNATQDSYIDTNIGDTLWETDTWSVSMWLKHSDTSFTYFAGTTSGNSVINGMIFGLYGDGSRFDMIWRNNGGTASRYQGGSLPINTWTNIVVTSNSNEVFFYQDGSLMTDYTGYSQPITAADIDHSQNFNIGRAGNASSYELMNGAIDQLRIFSSALSATQVRSLYDEVYCNTVSKLDIFDDSSCLALYEFEDNANSTDSSGNDGIEVGTVAYGGGQYKKGIIFNGTNTAIELPSALSNGSTTTAQTISFWFNVGAEVTSATTNNEIMSFAQSGTNIGKIALGSTSGLISNETFSVTSDVTNQYSFITDTIPAGWNHAVVQWETNKWQIYINGSSKTVTAFQTNLQGKFALEFGKRSTLYYDGELDQVRIFNRVLSPTEILQVYTE